MLEWLERMLNRLRGSTSGGAQQERDVHALDQEGDPRGGVQSDEYRHAAPTDVVEEGGTAMSGPGGAPEDDRGADERRQDERG